MANRQTHATSLEELETKLELSAEDFNRLRSMGSVERCVDQLTIYYDDQAKLQRQAATFRVRITNGQSPVMTLKIESIRAGIGLRRQALEIEQAIASPRLRNRRLASCDLPQSFVDQLDALGVSNLVRLGWVRAKRWVVAFGIDTVELDEVTLPNGTVFFEAEIDSPDVGVHERLTKLIQRTATSARPSLLNKYQRFLNARDSSRP